MAYVIKAGIPDPSAGTFVFAEQKTMYGGKAIAAGDVLYLFASENAGGSGLVARGVVTAAERLPPRPGLARQTPRVSIQVRRTGLALRPLGRAELKVFRGRTSGAPEEELDFKLYRQATDKIVGISPGAALVLESCF